MNILVFGDIVGKSGRAAVIEYLHAQKGTYDVVIANGENIAHGRGMTPDTAEELLSAGVHVLTGGNHILESKKGAEMLQKDFRIIRPANFPPGVAGKGSTTITVGMTTIAVLSLVGRVFFREQYDDPFRAVDAWLQTLPRVKPLLTFIDMHAEATSEKRAMGFYVDGRVTGIWGTHTHVPTADEQILPKGTAYITDLGLTGAYHSILGFSIPPILEQFKTQMRIPFDVVEEHPWELNALTLDVDEQTGTVRSLRRIREIMYHTES